MGPKGVTVRAQGRLGVYIRGGKNDEAASTHQSHPHYITVVKIFTHHPGSIFAATSAARTAGSEP